MIKIDNNHDDIEQKKAIDIFCSISSSEKESVENLLIPSLERTLGDFKLKIHFVDYTGNNKIEKIKSNSISVFIHKNNKQLGFGAAHNYLFKKVNPKNFFLIINPDIYCNERLILELFKAAEGTSNIGIIEARQLPYEHPKGYNQKTLEVNWASGACIFVNPKFFKEAGGFDEKFWMYCEDVDLSWRSWLAGYKVIHCPNAIAFHYTGGYFEYRDDRYYYEHLWSGINYLYLAYKYWGNIRLWFSILSLKRQDMAKVLKREIITELYKRLPMYKRISKNNTLIKVPLKKIKDKVGIISFNKYK